MGEHPTTHRQHPDLARRVGARDHRR